MNENTLPNNAMPMSEGLHANVPMARYLADPCPEPSLSASTVKMLISRSPLAAQRRHPRFGAEVSKSRASDLGSAAHAVLLEGGDVLRVIEDYEDYRTKAARAARDEAYEADEIPVFLRERDAISKMSSIAMEALLKRAGGGIPEATVIWQEGGVWCRARPDWLASELAVDYKTCKSAEPNSWIRKSLFPGGYDISAAWYLRGLEAIGEPREEYLFLAQEIYEPHDYSWISVDEEALERANKAIDAAVAQWKDLLESQAKTWPGYSKRVHYAELPAYRAAQLDEFATRGG